MITMSQGARIVVEQWLQARPDDVIHFIMDETKQKEMDAFVKATEACGAVPKVTILPKDSIQAGDDIEEMKHIMSYATAIVGATNYSFITTNAVRYALKHGAKFLSLPLSTNGEHSLLECDFITMNPKVAKRMGRGMLRKLRNAKWIRVTTKMGTDIRFEIDGRVPGMFHGVTARAKACGSASFEVYISPQETKTNGRVVLDGSMGYIGCVKQPVTIEVKDGYVCSIEQNEDGKKLSKFFESFHDSEMYCAAEFGIGLNQLSQCVGRSYIEDESTYGTCHIGMGRNLALYGQHDAAGHFDIVIHNPTIETDKGFIEIDGKYCGFF